MATRLDDLIQRQDSILVELDNLHEEELNSLANSAACEGDKARKLLRGLARSGNVGKAASVTSVRLTDTLTILPALPDFFVIDLLPLSDGSYHRERVGRTPVVGWQVENGNYVKPLIPSLPVTDRWAVLTPEGFVMTDQYTNVFAEAPLALKDWIKSEIEWLEYCNGGPVVEFPTVCNRVFDYSGPVANALGLMMAGRRDWTGTPKQLHKALSKFCDGIFVEMAGWPKGRKAFAAALKKLEPKLADADLFLRQSDDGRLVIYRQSNESGGGGGGASSTFQ